MFYGIVNMIASVVMLGALYWLGAPLWAAVAIVNVWGAIESVADRLREIRDKLK